MSTDNAWQKRLKDLKGLADFGEEQLGKLSAQLLSNEKFVAAMQTLITRSLSAKETLERSARSALSAMNLPSTEDLQALRAKVDGLEVLLGSVEKKVDSLIQAKKKSAQS